MDYFQFIFLFAFASGILIDTSWASPIRMGQDQTTQAGSDCTPSPSIFNRLTNSLLLSIM